MIELGKWYIFSSLYDKRAFIDEVLCKYKAKLHFREEYVCGEFTDVASFLESKEALKISGESNHYLIYYLSKADIDKKYIVFSCDEHKGDCNNMSIKLNIKEELIKINLNIKDELIRKYVAEDITKIEEDYKSKFSKLLHSTIIGKEVDKLNTLIEANGHGNVIDIMSIMNIDMLTPKERNTFEALIFEQNVKIKEVSDKAKECDILVTSNRTEYMTILRDYGFLRFSK